MALPKLLFYTHGLVDGGAERLWASLASAFKARGHEVVFAVDFDASENRGSLSPDIPLVVLGRNHVGATRRLARLIRQETPDIALSAVAGSNLKLACAATLAGTPMPIIGSYHGFEEWLSGRMSYLAYRLLPFFGRRLSRIVAVSTELADTLVSEWGAEPQKMRVLLNPVLAKGNPHVDESGLDAREDIVLAAGRLVPEKDFATLIRAFAKLTHRRARLVIMGKGPEQRALETLAQDLGVADRVLLPGYCNEPWSWYDRAKCLAVSSRTESFGNVIVEAMAHGLPVVATACAGPNEILDRGRYGTIVRISDAAALAAGIDAALSSPGDPEPRRRRAAEFSFASRFPAYAALIGEVVAETPLQPAKLGKRSVATTLA